MLIGVAGPKNSGKDTFANRFSLYVPCVIRAFAEPVKRTCKQLFLLTEHQMYDPEAKERVDERWNLTPRQMFQQVGTDYVRRQVDPNFWLKHLEFWYQKNNTGSHNIIVPDVRFQNEVDLIHRLGGKVVYIYRPVPLEDIHESEVSATQLQHIDYTIENKGTLTEFEIAIDNFVDHLQL